MVEPFLFLAALGILGAIVLPNLVRRGEAQARLRSAECIKNLLFIENGTDVSQLACPQSNLPYKSENRNGEQVLSCPDPEKHLGFDLSLVRRGRSWRLRPRFPETTSPSDGFVELENTRTFFEVGPRAVIIHKPPPRTLRRYVLLPLSVVFSLGIFLLAAVFLVDSLRSGSLGLGDLIAIAFLVVGAVATGAMIHEGIHRQEITLRKENRSVTVQDYYLGRAWTKPEELRPIRGVYPVFTGERFWTVAFSEVDGELHHRILFSSSGADWRAVALLNGVFITGSRNDETPFDSSSGLRN